LAQTTAFASVVLKVIVVANAMMAMAASTNNRMVTSQDQFFALQGRVCLAMVRIIDPRRRDIVLRCNISWQSAAGRTSHARAVGAAGSITFESCETDHVGAPQRSRGTALVNLEVAELRTN
jgi:hypothetical protein